MPPRLNLFTAKKAVSVFYQPSASTVPACGNNGSATSRRSLTTSFNTSRLNSSTRMSLASSRVQQQRMNSSKSDAKEQPTGASQTPLPHVSEEAAEMEKIMHKKCDGGTPASPELEQGTPVAEILQRDKEAQKHMPKVLQDQLKKPSGTRSFSTSTRRRQMELHGDAAATNDPSIAVVANMISQVTEQAAEQHPGLKFPAPAKLPKTENFRHRYDSLLEQFTKLMMRDGKLSVAQKNMSFILDHLRTAPPPSVNPKRPLLPGPPGPQLPLNPVLYLTLIVDSVAPLLKLRQQKGLAGGGAAVPVPVPLAQRQRRRTAIRWIIDASEKRRDSQFAQRVANELVAVAEGRSGVWEKREHAHKLGISSRSNLSLAPIKKGKR